MLSGHARIRLLALTALSFAPLSFSKQGITVNEACASGGCCINERGICDTGDVNYSGYENKSWIQWLVGC